MFLKILPEPLGIKLEKYTAFELAQKLFGKEVFKVIWEPLFTKKFNDFSSLVNFSWLWARIKKRTLQLGYVTGGFQTISNTLAQKIQEQGGKIVFNTLCSKVVSDVIKIKGGEAIMWRTGHSFIRAKAQQEKAVFAGELSGHFYFLDKLGQFFINCWLASTNYNSFKQPLKKKKKIKNFFF